MWTKRGSLVALGSEKEKLEDPESALAAEWVQALEAFVPKPRAQKRA